MNRAFGLHGFHAFPDKVRAAIRPDWLAVGVDVTKESREESGIAANSCFSFTKKTVYFLVGGLF